MYRPPTSTIPFLDHRRCRCRCRCCCGCRAQSLPPDAVDKLGDLAAWVLSIAETLTHDDDDEADRVRNVRAYVEDLIDGVADDPPVDDIAFTVGVLCAAIDPGDPGDDDLPGGMPPTSGPGRRGGSGSVPPIATAPIVPFRPVAYARRLSRVG